MALASSQCSVQRFFISHQEDSKTHQKLPCGGTSLSVSQQRLQRFDAENGILFHCKPIEQQGSQKCAFSWITSAVVCLFFRQKAHRILETARYAVAANRKLSHARRRRRFVPQRRSAILSVLAQNVELNVDRSEPLLVVVEV